MLAHDYNVYKINVQKSIAGNFLWAFLEAYFHGFGRKLANQKERGRLDEIREKI